ncbi:MAG: hypothetical protein LBI33_04885 [Propionibacteriaceae bacterium]|jgi:hypothetical protein|nr:hypothetical protein [Propionibacteriaceae bacterium]
MTIVEPQWGVYPEHDPAGLQTPVSGTQGQWVATPPRLGYAPETPLPFHPGTGKLVKQGEWTVPPFLFVRAGMGTTVLDFQRAVPAAAVIYIKIAGGMGQIHFVVPAGWSADLTTIDPGWGTRKSEVPEQPVPGYPLLYISGSLAMGTLKIRYPKRRDLKRLAKQLETEQAQLR